MSHTILRLPEVKGKTGLSRSTIYLWIKAGKFPKQLKLGARSSGWIESDIDKWIDGKVAANGRAS